MKVKRILLGLLIYSHLLFLMACNTKTTQTKCAETKEVPYQIVVDKIELVSKTAPIYLNIHQSLEFPKALPGDTTFRHLAEYACFYKISLIKIIQDSTKTYPQKEIAMYALHRLCIDDFVDALQAVFEQYKLGRVDEDFLKTSISGHYDISIEVIKNYNHQKLVKTLQEIRSFLLNRSLKDPSIIRSIDDILWGSDWRNIWHRYNELGWYCGKKLK